MQKASINNAEESGNQTKEEGHQTSKIVKEENK
jgi:hypothetical protein